MKKLMAIVMALVIMSACAITAFATENDYAVYHGKLFYKVADIKTENTVIVNENDEELADDALVPNGAYLVTTENGVVSKVQICIKEDVNCDGRINAADARMALRHGAQLEHLEGVSFFAADMNDDNKVTAADARIILRKPAGV